jgi:hypothetical protein
MEQEDWTDVHLPWFRQGLEEQGSILDSHMVPTKHAGQLHSYSVQEVGLQTPPFWHGLLAQGSKTVLQVGPELHPVQLQVNT